jgi:hypothetical protein
MPRLHRSRATASLVMVAGIVLSLSGCFAAPTPTSAPDAAATTSEASAPPLDCLERSRVIDPEEALEYHVNSLLGLHQRGGPNVTLSGGGRYVIGFEADTFTVEPAMDFQTRGDGAIADTRQTGILTGRYSVDGDGVISTSEVDDGRVLDSAVDPASGLAAERLRRFIDHNPIEGAVAHCDGDDLVLELSQPDGGHFTVHLPAA